MGIDSEVLREGVRLTVFGISTAFGLLILLMVMTWTLGRGVSMQERRAISFLKKGRVRCASMLSR